VCCVVRRGRRLPAPHHRSLCSRGVPPPPHRLPHLLHLRHPHRTKSILLCRSHRIVPCCGRGCDATTITAAASSPSPAKIAGAGGGHQLLGAHGRPPRPLHTCQASTSPHPPPPNRRQHSNRSWRQRWWRRSLHHLTARPPAYLRVLQRRPRRPPGPWRRLPGARRLHGPRLQGGAPPPPLPRRGQGGSASATAVRAGATRGRRRRGAAPRRGGKVGAAAGGPAQSQGRHLRRLRRHEVPALLRLLRQPQAGCPAAIQRPEEEATVDGGALQGVQRERPRPLSNLLLVATICFCFFSSFL
jgi:hypothetical protein